MSELKLQVRSSGGQVQEVPAQSSWSVRKVKEFLQDKFNVTPENMRLIFKGRILKDPDTLEMAKVESGAVLHMIKTSAGVTQSTVPTAAAVPGPAAAPVPATSAQSQTINPPSATTQASPVAGMMPGFDPFAMMGGMGGMSGMGGMPFDPQMISQMMQNPMVQQMMQNMMSNPELMRAMFQNHPLLQTMSQNNPFMAEALHHPELIFSGMSGAAQHQQDSGAPGASTGTASTSSGTASTSNPFADAFQRMQDPAFQQQMQQLLGGITGGPAPAQSAPATAHPTPSSPPTAGGTSGSGGPANIFEVTQRMMQDPAMRQQMEQMMSGMRTATHTSAAAGGETTNAPATGAGAAGSNPFTQAMEMMRDPGFQQQMSQMFGGPGGPWGAMSSGAGEGAASTAGNQQSYESELQRLTDMGFTDRDMNLQALRVCGGDVNAAINWLLEHGSGN